MATVEWDAAAYDRVADPQARWGEEVLARLPLRGDETVLDAGCGTGRVTELLLARLLRGRVLALDSSPAMLAEARRRLAAHASRVDFVEADLGRPLPLPGPVDAVLSTATFHWVPDHDALFRHLHAVLVPGGRLVAQAGGAGNCGPLWVAAERRGGAAGLMRNFPTGEETEARLRAAGFVEAHAWLEEKPTYFPPGEPFEDFLRTVVLRLHVAAMAEAEARSFAHSVAEELGEPRLDYVRLNLDAVA